MIDKSTMSSSMNFENIESRKSTPRPPLPPVPPLPMAIPGALTRTHTVNCRLCKSTFGHEESIPRSIPRHGKAICVPCIKIHGIKNYCATHAEYMQNGVCPECSMSEYYAQREHEALLLAAESGITLEELEQQAIEEYIGTADWAYDQYHAAAAAMMASIV